MADLDVLERRVIAVLLDYVGQVPDAVDAAAVARRVALEHPRRRAFRVGWRPTAVPRVAWVLLAALLLAIAGALVVGSQPELKLPAVVPPVGQVATCPPGSTPDEPGPVGQARPAEEHSATAFDRRAGRLVVVTDGSNGVETWTFDVCANIWTQMAPNREPPSVAYSPQLVYDVDSDVTIWVSEVVISGVASEKVWAYNLQADTCTEKSAAPTIGFVFLAYDPVSGLVVAAPHPEIERTWWNYEVETDTWIPIHQANAGPSQRVVIAYDGSVDRLVAYGDAAYGSTPYETWLFDIRTGTWSRSAAERPAVAGWLTAPGSVYDEAAERTLIFARAPLTAYDARADRWEILAAPESISPPTDPWHSAPSVYVYDAVNRRLVGWRVGGNRNQESGVAALDLTNRKWTVLLEPSGRSSSTPVPRPEPTSAPMATPPGGPEETDLTSPVPTASPTSTP
jgi:hypothetical protein